MSQYQINRRMLPKPKNLEFMKRMAEVLSADFGELSYLYRRDQ